MRMSRQDMVAGCARVATWLAWAGLLLGGATGTSTCEFPAFVQSNGTGVQRFWKGGIRNQNADQTLDVTFLRFQLILHGQSGTVRRTCLHTLQNNKFLVESVVGEEAPTFLCMQILQRAPGVIQLASSPARATKDISDCDDARLDVDPWIVLDSVGVLSQREQCSLYGGYNVNNFDRMSYRTKCDAYHGETRVESECEPGAGLHFQFRRTACVPEGLYMYSSQVTVCLANWQQGNWRFSLLKHDLLEYMWVLRYPSVVSDTFTAHLFKDLVEDSGRTVTASNNYVRIDMMRDPPHHLTSLCTDDYEVCDVWKDPCSYNSDMALTCARTCGVCNVSRPAPCTFEPQLRGQWKDATHPHSAAITINDTALHVHGFEIFHCIDFNMGRSIVADDEGLAVQEKLLVTVSAGGCKPRYTCARLRQSAPSVLFLQMSASRMWPLTDSPAEQVTCNGFSYNIDHSMPMTTFRSRHLKPLISEHLDTYVECDMHAFARFVVTFADGTQCTGSALQPHTKDSIQLDFSMCPAVELPVMHHCLEHTKMHTDVLIMTKTVAEPTTVFCWIFPRRPKNTFYLVEASHCNEVSSRRLRKGRLQPYATFTKPRRHAVHASGSADSTSNRTSLRSIPGLTNVDPVLDQDATPRNDTPHNATDTTPPPKDNSPFVVAAVVVTFLILQIPCMCKK